MMKLAKRLELDIGIEFPGFRLQIDQATAIDGVLGLFGPSGAGKSTILRIVAGVESSATGKLKFDGEVWQDTSNHLFVKPFKRAIGCVFQSPQLFPHLSVSGNLEYGYRRKRGRRGPELTDVLHAMDLKPLLSRPVDALSGGERQRVALGRALLAAPRLMLLDEPMAALDDARKSEIMPYLERVVGDFGIPSIFVSHSVAEVSALSTDAWILENGRVTGCGLSELPSTYGPVIRLSATVVGESKSGLLICRIGDDEILAKSTQHLERESLVNLMLLESSVLFAATDCPGMPKAGAIRGVVDSVAQSENSGEIRIEFKTKGGNFELLIPPGLASDFEISKGQPACAIVANPPLAERI
ncbi:MAG: ATP-binding cassette domain-containing protein [Albidovulum sp.]|nr:ATP-binding cassette domain-containing protein [Albidovulum sp.]